MNLKEITTIQSLGAFVRDRMYADQLVAATPAVRIYADRVEYGVLNNPRHVSDVQTLISGFTGEQPTLMKPEKEGAMIITYASTTPLHDIHVITHFLSKLRVELDIIFNSVKTVPPLSQEQTYKSGIRRFAGVSLIHSYHQATIDTYVATLDRFGVQHQPPQIQQRFSESAAYAVKVDPSSSPAKAKLLELAEFIYQRRAEQRRAAN